MANSVFDFRVLKHGRILMINIKLLADHLLKIKLRKIRFSFTSTATSIHEYTFIIIQNDVKLIISFIL